MEDLVWLAESDGGAWIGCVEWIFILFFMGLMLSWHLRNQRRKARAQSRDWISAVASAFGGTPLGREEQPGFRFELSGFRCVFHNWTTFSGDLIGSAVEAHVGVAEYLEAVTRDSKRRPMRIPRARHAFVVRGFRVATSNAVWARRHMEGVLGERLDRLRRLTGRPLRVQLSQTRFMIDQEGVTLHERKTIQSLVEQMAALLNLFFGETVAVTIEEVRFTLEKGICLICMTPLDSQVVHCNVCATPHHAECWSYFGRCSTFACAGRRAG